MRISEILSSSVIKTDLKATDKYAAYKELVALLSASGRVEDAAAAYNAVVEREEKMSTSIIPRVALPHGKLKDMKNVALALGVSKKGVEYDSMDGNPVNVIFLVISEEGKPELHLNVLSGISRLISEDDFVQALMNAASAEDTLRLITAQE